MFEENINPNIPCYWYFKRFFRSGEYDVSKFPKLPEMAFYCDDPSKLIYDIRKELVVNIEHMILDNKPRFPEPCKSCH